MPKVRPLIIAELAPEPKSLDSKLLTFSVGPHLPLPKENLLVVMFQVPSMSPEDFLTSRSAARGWNLWGLRWNTLLSAVCTSVVSLGFGPAVFKWLKVMNSICGPGPTLYVWFSNNYYSVSLRTTWLLLLAPEVTETGGDGISWLPLFLFSVSVCSGIQQRLCFSNWLPFYSVSFLLLQLLLFLPSFERVAKFINRRYLTQGMEFQTGGSVTSAEHASEPTCGCSKIRWFSTK